MLSIHTHLRNLLHEIKATITRVNSKSSKIYNVIIVRPGFAILNAYFVYNKPHTYQYQLVLGRIILKKLMLVCIL
jgi:hypothetical protein